MTKRKPGRPRTPGRGDPNEPEGEGGKLLANYRGKRTTQFVFGQRIRDENLLDPVLQSFKIIAMGFVPVWIDDKRCPGGYRVEPDPNPLLPATTLEQRLRAYQVLLDRGEGLPVTQVNIKHEINHGVPEHLLKQNNYAALDVILRGLKQLEDGNTQDAEWSPVQEPCMHLHIDMSGKCPDCGLQEPSQVETGADLKETSELQEVDQSASDSPSNIKENSAPEGDSSAL